MSIATDIQRRSTTRIECGSANSEQQQQSDNTQSPRGASRSAPSLSPSSLPYCMYQHPKAGPPLDEDLDQAFDYNSIRLGSLNMETIEGYPRLHGRNVNWRQPYTTQSISATKANSETSPQQASHPKISPLSITQTYNPLNKRGK